MIFYNIIQDIKAIYRNDPAVKNIEFILYPGLHSMLIHRIIHPLYKIGLPFIPRLISQISRFLTGIEMHPGAEIGPGFFIDHGAGIVIGETAEIGKNCVMFHNVTLGGTGRHVGKRHPTVGDNVLIGTGAIILGPVKIGDNVRVGANTFLYMVDIPDNCTVAGTPGVITRLNGEHVNIVPKRTNSDK